MANQFVDDLRIKIKSGNPVTRLIIINVAVFVIISLLRVLFFVSGNDFVSDFPNSILGKNIAFTLTPVSFVYRPWTIITYMFVHIDIMHIFWNMVTLYWFGTILSEFTNSKKIIPLYLLGGIAGAVFTVFAIAGIPGLLSYSNLSLIGASAGVTAIIIASATLVPEYRMNLMFIGPVKLIYVAAFVIFIDVLNVASYSNIGGNLAHLGGAIMGFIFIRQYKKGNDLSKGINIFFTWIVSVFKRTKKTKMKVAYKRAMTDEEINYQRRVSQQEVDAILDKISKSGYESLNKNEKDILFRASTKK